jgi:AcrR family transcriptional regulator
MAIRQLRGAGRGPLMADQAMQARRAYRSPRREQQAAETRAIVVAAAARLFGERGWASTGMRDVARASGVSVETVYAGSRSKGDLLLAAIDHAVVGDAAPVPLDQRPEFAALGSGTRQQRVTAAARLVTGINQRTAGVILALREAAASDAELARLMGEREQRRRTNVEQGAALIAGRAVTAEEVDGLWAVLAVEVYQLLTGLRGWTPQQYENWLSGVIDHLLPGPDQRS